VNTLIRPHIPTGSEPTRDDDPTGVRALLSSLPEPEPMPEHLVERINASLAAEQAQRASTVPGTSVTPLLATPRRRRARLLLAVAGAAAAVAVVAVVGTNELTSRQGGTTSSASIASAPITPSTGPGEASGAASSNAADKAQAPALGPVTPSLIQIGLSQTRYTRTDFTTEAQALRHSVPGPIRPQPTEPSSLGPAGTMPGLKECLNAIGVTSAQSVRADVAFYEGRPAVIIVATTNGIPVAYAVGRQCSHSNPAVLHPATPLP
jgi:hypothetical protein